ncbi:hypothetical protein [Microbacter margulisiae]|uniref:Uncharacterized protein n=1 Tax=Microbacter margulisiae TaxID=1350067 RepID=A0A7W5DSA6_9PORP|nr:hypothetical protein [Microbacter margulisiae]MBB3187823.1 hypothetical protein [Microbacter margulisiae]
MTKKSILCIFVTIQLLLLNGVSAQNLSDSLGGIKTHFQLYSDTINLQPGEQFMLLRAEKKYTADPTFGYGWGYGYRSYHLEFTTNKNIVVETFKYHVGYNNDPKLVLSFYDVSGLLLSSLTFPFDRVSVCHNFSSTGSPFFYSIDLIEIPISLLDHTAKIGIIKLEARK